MVVKIITSTEDNNAFRFNLGYLQRAMISGAVRKQGERCDHNKELVYEGKAKIYDFTRTAQAQVREEIVSFLNTPNVLPGLQEEGLEEIRETFGGFFIYARYKDHLKGNDDRQEESMSVLIFNDGNGKEDQPQYVAYVFFSSTARKTAEKQFKVNFKLSCRRLTYLEAQNEELDAFRHALENLRL